MKQFIIVLGVLACLFAAPALADVNVNTATAEELQALEGIGDAKAQAIIAYREAHGDIENMADLKKVDGIGAATAKALADDVTFGAK